MPQEYLDNQSIDIACTKCGRKTPKTVGWIRRYSYFDCAGCGTRINLERDQFINEATKISREFENLRRSIERTNRGSR
jgi:DNA-directed RNA polymerase subunit RPC12/RpoP